MLNAAVKARGLPHVIVVGNEKGGSGKTTIAMHIAVALMKSGQRLATIDLDGRQRTLTCYVENRRAWARRCHVDLELPTHVAIARAEGPRTDENEAAEFADFDRAISAIERHHDFLLIDTDTLVTPLNDSFLDLDVLAKIDPVTFAVIGVSHYAELVREMRRRRRSVDGDLTDHVVVRNRISPSGSAMEPVISDCLQELALAVGFRVAHGFHERAVYRDLFPRGLTALDAPHSLVPALDPDSSYSLARHEVQALLDVLKLPIDDRGRRRAVARSEWLAARSQPLDTGDVLAELPH